MKTFTIYYNNLDIDNKRKIVTIEKDCPRLVQSGEWKTWFCPELVKDEGYVLKAKEEYECEMDNCKNTITEEEYNFCDICPDCRDEIE